MGKKKRVSEPEYAVERIIDHRVSKQTSGAVTFQNIEINIKWDGYASIYNTWEPLTTIYFDIKAMTRQYFKDKGWELICKLKSILSSSRRRDAASATKNPFDTASQWLKLGRVGQSATKKGSHLKKTAGKSSEKAISLKCIRSSVQEKPSGSKGSTS